MISVTDDKEQLEVMLHNYKRKKALLENDIRIMNSESKYRKVIDGLLNRLEGDITFLEAKLEGLQ